MRKRSLLSSSLGIIKAKQAFNATGWTQYELAAEVGLATRQSIWKFFKGKPIERHLFIEICLKLNLDWEEIAEPEGDSSATIAKKKTLAQQRQLLQQLIQNQCALLQSSVELLQPLPLKEIYTEVKVLPYLTSQRWLEVEDLEKAYFLEKPSLNRNDHMLAIEAIKKPNKVVIFGKPGAGKTTFLQYLALQTLEEKFHPELIPVFIPLRSLSAKAYIDKGFSLIEYVTCLWEKYDFTRDQVQFLAEDGKLLLLLDGIDELSLQGREPIINEIQNFVDLYPNNHVIITCRLGYWDYFLRGFSYLEIADFDHNQLENFVSKWFTLRLQPQEAVLKTQQLLAELSKSANQAIKDMAVTPILLSLICSVFEKRSNFPSKRTKLYQTGLEILLVRWDQTRGIVRDNTYHNLDVGDKINLLSQIAFTTLTRGKVFFEKRELVQIISEFLKTFTTWSAETIWSDSENLLKSIQSQHGLLVEQAKDIYSFSHLTFQEYLTAQKVTANQQGADLDTALEKLATYIGQPQWQEVILMTIELLHNSDFLLQKLKENLDNILKNQTKIKEYLKFLQLKQNFLDLNYKPAGVRAFYFNLLRNRPLNLAISVDVNLASNLHSELALDLFFARALALGNSLVKQPEIKKIISLGLSLDFEIPHQPLKQEIYKLKSQLLASASTKKNLMSWWEQKGKSWVKDFRQIVVKYRYFEQDWQFTPTQEKSLETYSQANQFLVQCLQSDCQLSLPVKQQIEDNLLII